MAKHTYPAIFEKENEGGYSIYFPDVDGCYTQSEDIAEGLENASDALCLMLYELEKQGKPIPTPTNISNIAIDGDNIITLVACDTRLYKNYFEGKSAKVSATIPLWLKEEGEKRNVNFSQILQSGLKEYLGLTGTS